MAPGFCFRCLQRRGGDLPALSGYRRSRGALDRRVVGVSWFVLGQGRLLEHVLFIPEPSTLMRDWGAQGRSRRAPVVLGRRRS